MMTTTMTRGRRRWLLTGAAACLGVLAASPALAQSAPAPSDNLTVNLMNLLVKQKVITQEAADGLLAEARRQTAEAQAARPAPPAAGDELSSATAALDTAATALSQAAARLRAAEMARATTPPPPAQAASGDMALATNLPAPAAGATRIPYVPEPVKNQIRDELRQEVIQLAKAENWAQPNAIPAWTKRLQITGDVRFREFNDLYSSINDPQIVNFAALNANGPTDINKDTNNGQIPILNTRRNRALQMAIRARLDVRADPGDWVTADIRLASGSSNSPVSTTQLLGGGLTKKDIWLDRAYIDLHPRPWANATFGRMPNPFFSTDLVYDTDLNFDGVAAHGAVKVWPSAGLSLFVTEGAFLTDSQDVNFPTTSLSDQKTASERKWLFASQVGAEWERKDFRWKTGVAYYSFRGAQGRLSEPCSFFLGETQCSTDFTRPAFMQKGNTLFLIRKIDPTAPNHTTNLSQPEFVGLTFPFHVLNVTSTLDLTLGGGTHLELTGDYARNLAYKYADACRYGVDGGPVSNLVGGANEVLPCSGTGPNVPQLRSGPNAFMVRASYGHPDPDRWGQWNVAVGYKHLAGDSVLDAYTDSDFHLGGTNAKGYFLLGTLGLATNTNIQLRWFSANEVSGPKMSIDTAQIDINTRF